MPTTSYWLDESRDELSLRPFEGTADVAVIGGGVTGCSCALTRTIPNLGSTKNRLLWSRVEEAKRRLVYDLCRLKLPLKSEANQLSFDILSDDPEEGPIMTGHSAGLITLNLAEADDLERETRRVAFREPYRTLLGHFRHEITHYYWSRLVANSASLEQFREPAFRLEELAAPLPFEEAAARIPQLVREEAYVKLWWLPHTDVVQVYRCRRTDSDSTFRAFARWFDDRVVNRVVFAALLRLSRFAPSWIPRINALIRWAYFRETRKVARSDLALTIAMRQVGVRRVAVESTAFLFKDSFLPLAYLIGKLFFPITVADAAAMEQIIGKSGLDWTIVRPPRLTNKPRTGNYRVREGHLPGFGFTISRADVADFMIETVEKRASIGKVVGVCN